MVDRLPGFTFDDGDSVRGFAGAAGNVLIDGERPASKNDDLDSILRRLPASQVDRIEVIRGGAPGIDMQGKTVMANVVRRKGASSTLVVAYQQSLMTSDGRQSPRIRLEGSHQTADGRSWEAGIIGSGGFDDGLGDGSRITQDAQGHVLATARDDTEGDFTSWTGTGAYAQQLLGGKLKLNASLNTLQYYSDESVQDVASATQDTHERDHNNQEVGELGLHYTRPLTPTLASETILLQQATGADSLSLFDTDPAHDGEVDRFREQQFQGESIAREVLTWTASRRLTIEYGAEGAYNLLHSHTRYAVDAVDQAVPAADVQVAELRGEAFAKASWKATRTLNVELGLRIEASHITSAGDVTLAKTLVYPKPRLALSWSPTRLDQLRFRLEEEVGQLNFSDFTAASSFSTGQVLAGNPNLTPQQALVVEGAWERHFLGDGAAVLTLRHSKLTDVVDRAPVSSPSGPFDAPANIGGGSKDEAILDVTLPLDRLHIPGGLLKTDTTWRRSHVTDPTTGERRPISGLRPLEGKVTFSQDVPRWRLTWGGSVDLGWRQSYFYFNQVETDILTPIGGLFAEVKPAPGWSVRAQMDDIGIGFDRRLAVYAGLRTPGPYDILETRDLSLGPLVSLRVRKSW